MREKIIRLVVKTKLTLIKTWSILREGAKYIGRVSIKAAKKAVFFTKKTALGLIKGFALILDDILLVAGITCITRGVFLIYVPAGYIVLGLCLFGMAYLIAYRKATVRR